MPEASRFGVGRDAIPAIDTPVFVAPGDPRLKRVNVGQTDVAERVAQAAS